MCITRLNKEYWLLVLPVRNTLDISFKIESGDVSVDKERQTSNLFLKYLIWIIFIWISIIIGILFYCFFLKQKLQYARQFDEENTWEHPISVRQITQNDIQTDTSKNSFKI